MLFLLTTKKEVDCICGFHAHINVFPSVLVIQFYLGINAVQEYRKTSNISRTLVGNKIVDNSDVVGVSPVGDAPTTSSLSTWLQWTGRRQLQDDTRNILVLGFGATYTTGFTVNVSHGFILYNHNKTHHNTFVRNSTYMKRPRTNSNFNIKRRYNDINHKEKCLF